MSLDDCINFKVHVYCTLCGAQDVSVARNHGAAAGQHRCFTYSVGLEKSAEAKQQKDLDFLRDNGSSIGAE